MCVRVYAPSTQGVDEDAAVEAVDLVAAVWGEMTHLHNANQVQHAHAHARAAAAAAPAAALGTHGARVVQAQTQTQTQVPSLDWSVLCRIVTEQTKIVHWRWAAAGSEPVTCLFLSRVLAVGSEVVSIALPCAACHLGAPLEVS